MKQDKKMIYTVTGIFITIFALLVGYMIYFNIFKQKEMSVHPQNTRLNNLESEVVRGKIYDSL
ncbi:MAG: penicillin-binding protein 2, partial [Cellulosilyticum sp.]|nr:penicillin-binding protein 2 [Cellulosilyticum sp.]